MSAITLIGGGLSVLAILLFGYMLVDCVRSRDRLRTIRAAGRSIDPGWMSLFWAVAIIACFLAGLDGQTLRSERVVGSAPEMTTTGDRIAATRASTIRLPFYIHSIRSTEMQSGDRHRASTSMSLQMPWIFVLAAGLYLALAKQPGGKRVAQDSR